MKYSNKWVEEIVEKENVKFLFFWGHQALKNGETGKSCFSQWFEINFKYEENNYPTAEHWMMAEKARLFNDKEILLQVLKSNSAGEVKKLGRQIKNFDEQIWNDHKFEIVRKGNFLKFDQNKDLKEFLLNTNNRILAEASPVDAIWGIGMASDNVNVENPSKWEGENLLGYALMEVRDLLKINS
ncbi:MAG: ribA/ribD-fused uncharacterized protein [Flavobacteriales bacterium]|jgi:ribA/ribD-fused uncharacterized protein